MNRVAESTPAAIVRGAFMPWNATHYRHPTTRNGDLVRAVVPVFVAVLTTLTCPAAVRAAAFTASGSMWQDFYAPIPPGTSTSSPTHAMFEQQYQTGDLNLLARSEASRGNIELFTLASINGMTNWASGHVSSTSSAGILEPVYPLWQFLAGYAAPLAYLTFDYEVWVAGNLNTTSAGPGAAGGEAGLQYSYRVGDSSGGGYWSKNSAGQVSQSGTWNSSIKGSFTVQKGSTFNLQLAAIAGGGGSKTYVPGSNATVVAMADFSHTMTWMGITGVRAFDSLGNELPLPADAYLPLIGRESGFDYWYAAGGASEVPEPAAVLLVGSGFVVAGLMRRSAARRRGLNRVRT